MALSCIIVDDEPLAVKLLESFVTKTPELTLLASFTDSVEAINAVKEQKPNLLFLDIQMPDLNGMELAHMIPSETRVIFTTAFKEYAFESYEVRALDFLLKPIRYNKFLAAIDKAKEWYLSRKENLALPLATEGTQEGGRRKENTPAADSEDEGNLPPPSTFNPPPKTLFLKVDGEYRQIAISDILYVSGMKDYVMFYLVNEHRPLVTYLRMKAVEEMLPPTQFMRVHRSFIVCLEKIRKVDRNDCIYIGDEIIHVTEAYLPAFQQYLNSKFPGK